MLAGPRSKGARPNGGVFVPRNPRLLTSNTVGLTKGLSPGRGANRVDGDAERRLVTRCGAGDWKAFEMLLAAHRDQAYRLAYRLTGSHADADDVLQDACLRAFRGMSKFDGRARFGTWFWRILVRAGADHERRRKRQPVVANLAQVEEPRAPAARRDPSERAAASELNEALNEALQSLSAEQRVALVLISFEGMSYAEAAEVQQCPQGTLAWRVAEARRRLVEKLAPYL